MLGWTLLAITLPSPGSLRVCLLFMGPPAAAALPPQALWMC